MARGRRTTQQNRELEELNATIQGAAASTPRNNAPVEPNPETHPGLNMEQLLTALTAAVSRRDSQKHFQPPQYNGESDIDLFITQFDAVAIANNWQEDEATLRLKLSLQGKAANCSQAPTREEIYENLRSRFGLTPKQAKDMLRSIRKNPNQSLHELGCEITKLTNLAYGNLSKDDRTEMALDTFARALEHVGVQRHLLQAKPTSMSEMVKCCDEFFQVGKESKTKLTAITEEETESPPVFLKEVLQQQQQLLTALVKQQQDASTQQAALLKQITEIQAKASRPRTPPACYTCNGPHLQRNCPLRKNQAATPAPDQPAENSKGAAQ